jgi:transcriptional regulator with XRE-family HTH domain
MDKFGEKIKALRTRRGTTLKELAAALGLSAHGYISELEGGKKTPTVELVIKIAEFFNVSTDELLKDDLKVQYSSVNERKPQPSTPNPAAG